MANRSNFGRAVALRGRLCHVAALFILALPCALRAQEVPGLGPDTAAAAADTGPHLVRGRVVRPGGRGVVPVPGVWVTLHRVGSDTAAPLDSMRTPASGAYAFRYRHTGRADAVYFVSASYHGIAYFSLPLQKPRVTGDDAEITVYDTSAGPLTLHVRGHHVVIGAPNSEGVREVVEVYELTNDSSVTLVSRDDAHPTWSAIVPASATDFQVGQGDISPQSVRQETGSVATVAPFAPGLKQLSFSYRLPASAFPLSFPLEQEQVVLEVLVEEPTARVSGARLAAVQPVSIEGRRFSRYLAQNAPANAVVTIDAPTPQGARRETRYLAMVAIAIAVAMAGALALFLVRRRRPAAAPAQVSVPPVPPVPPVADDETALLARTIAELDAEFERRASPTAEERAAYDARRAELKHALARALDARRQHV